MHVLAQNLYGMANKSFDPTTNSDNDENALIYIYILCNAYMHCTIYKEFIIVRSVELLYRL